MGFLIVIMGMFFICIIAVVYIIQENGKANEEEESKFGDVLTLRKFSSDFNADRSEHNMTLILNLIEGNTQMGSESLVLPSLKGWYQYYYHEDLILWLNDDVSNNLKEMGYNVYENSADNLIITYDENRSQ